MSSYPYHSGLPWKTMGMLVEGPVAHRGAREGISLDVLSHLSSTIPLLYKDPEISIPETPSYVWASSHFLLEMGGK